MNIDGIGSIAASVFFGGLEILEDPYLPEYEVESRQKVFPKSKKKRIREKFRKDRKNWEEIRTQTAYRMGNKVIMYPAVAARMREILQGILPSTEGSTR